MKSLKINSNSEIFDLKIKILESINRTLENLKGLLNDPEKRSLDIFHDLKFGKLGYDLVEDSDEFKELNFLEQLNRCYSDLVICEAGLEILQSDDVKDGAIQLNFGVTGGTDVKTLDGKVGAEVFSSVNPRNNQKIKKDIEKVSDKNTTFEKRYVIYYSPDESDFSDLGKSRGVEIKRIDRERLLRVEKS